ncbi:hypothetical protein E1B28_011160 [Marasmius oreades]|uniref:MI domain-containing protein n=1 Tax=Marasmius oreades TaxID=181124 RepID=A0A9P7UPN5_9AGAR|nr:uncharacterized protein E1B28_011160 [Marasmius oreades]KAG7089478.1 hypothetical protein E1B28_011160 [Marasmius oreades]
MPARTKTSTTRLPQNLLEQIGQSAAPDSDNQPRRRSSKTQISRKDARKQERAQRKQKKAEYFTSQGVKRAATEELHDTGKQSKRKKLYGSADGLGRTKPNASAGKITEIAKTERSIKATASKTVSSSKTIESTLSKRVKKSTVPLVRAPRTQREKEEDAYIAHLESKLGYSGKGKKTKYNDGLDDLLDFTTGLELKRIGISASDDESEEMEGTTSGEDEAGEEDESESEEHFKKGLEQEWKGIEHHEDEDEELESAAQATFSAESSEILPESQTSSQELTKYIPPHLRNTGSISNSEALLKLTKQLKGLLNRMSEQNIGSILDSVEELFRNNRRHDITSTLTTLIIDGISSHSSLLDSYVVLHAAFVASLYKMVGVELAAYFVQNVVSSYEQHLDALRDESNDTSPVTEAKQHVNDEGKGKEASNLIILLSELYNFQVISCVLVYDIIRGLLDGEIKEIQVELLLKIVRSSGHQLRQDDPSSLRDIIQIVQGKMGGNESELSSRTRFMIETLNNLRNNKVKRIGAQNQGEEAVERMRKFLSGLSKRRHVLAHEPLRVSLQDLHSADTKGKWWLVGAAWGGDPLVDRQGAKTDAGKDKGILGNERSSGNTMENSALLRLARKQGMNTDIRRSIFVVLMSSDDYVDACERLSELKLSEMQQRDIARVLVHCCGNEKTYNPYYTLVCQHLCRFSHSYKITLQYCLWDFLRDMGETEVGGMEVIKNLKDEHGFDVKSISPSRMKNVAKAYAWWIAKDCVSLLVLKPIDFSQLKPQAQDFLEELFVHIFLSSQSSSPLTEVGGIAIRNRGSVEEIFIKATKVQTLAMGLIFFFSKVFRFGTEDQFNEETRRLVKWGMDVAEDTIQTGLDIVPRL